MAQTFLSLAEVASVLRCSLERAEALVTSGAIEAVRLGGPSRWRVSHSEVERYQASSPDAPPSGSDVAGTRHAGRTNKAERGENVDQQGPADPWARLLATALLALGEPIQGGVRGRVSTPESSEAQAVTEAASI